MASQVDASAPPLHLIALAATNYPQNHKRNMITTVFLAIFLVAVLFSPRKIVLAVEHATTHLLLDLQRAHEARTRSIVHAVTMISRFFMLTLRLLFLLAFVVLEQVLPMGWRKVKPVENEMKKPELVTGFDEIMSKSNGPRPFYSKSCPVSSKGRPNHSALSGRSRSFTTSGSQKPKSILGKPQGRKSTSKSVVFEFRVAVRKPSTSRKTVPTKADNTIAPAESTPKAVAVNPDAKGEVGTEGNPDLKEHVSNVSEDIAEVVEATPEVPDVADTMPEVKEEIPAVQEENIIVEQPVNDADSDSVNELVGVIESPIREEMNEPFYDEDIPIASDAIPTHLSELADSVLVMEPSTTTMADASTPELSSDSASLATTEQDPYSPEQSDISIGSISQSTPVGHRRSVVDQVKLVAKKIMPSKSSSSVLSGRRVRKISIPEMPRLSSSSIVTDDKRKRMSWTSLHKTESIKSIGNSDLISVTELADGVNPESHQRKKLSHRGSFLKRIVGKDKVDVDGEKGRATKFDLR